MLNPETGGLQQQKTMSGSTFVSQELKAEAAASTDSPKLDCSKNWKTLPVLINLDFFLDTQLVGSKFDINSMNPLAQTALCHQSRLLEML